MKVAAIDTHEVPLDWVIDELIAKGFDVVEEVCRTEDDVVKVCHDADVVLFVVAPITANVLENLGRCRALIKCGIGVDTLDVQAATDLGIAVANSAGFCAEDVAEHALGLALSLTRGIVAGNRSVRGGTWDRNQIGVVRRFSSLTVGIVGLGAIGSSMARKCEALGARVVFYDANTTARHSPSWERADLETLLREVDVLSIHVPLDSDTSGMIGQKELALMKPGAWVVNTSRGGVVDEAALTRALERGELAGAGLDVWDPEPMPVNEPILNHPSVAVTPHHAGMSVEAFDELRNIVFRQVVEVADGNVPSPSVNGLQELR